MGTAAAEALLHFATASERELREDSASAQARQALAEHELTRVQEAQARARQSESQLRLVLDTIPHAINFVDAQERYVLNNDTYRSWFGLEPEQIRGRTVREVVGEENYRAIKPFIDRALAGEEDYERPFVFQGGRRGYVHGHFVPHRAPDGRVLGYVALVQDITERYQLMAQLQAARAELERSAAQPHGLFEYAPAILATLRGPELVFELVNPLFQRAVAGGRPLVGLPLRDALPEVVAQGFVALMDGVYRSGVPYVGREVLLRLDRRGDGKLEDTWWTFVYQPTRTEGGEVEGVAVFGFEVTEHVRARREAEGLAAPSWQAIFEQLPRSALRGRRPRHPARERAGIELLGYGTVAEVRQSIARSASDPGTARGHGEPHRPPEDTRLHPGAAGPRGRAGPADAPPADGRGPGGAHTPRAGAGGRRGGGAVAINRTSPSAGAPSRARREERGAAAPGGGCHPRAGGLPRPRRTATSSANAALPRRARGGPRALPGRHIHEVIGEESYRRILPYIERRARGRGGALRVALRLRRRAARAPCRPCTCRSGGRAGPGGGLRGHRLGRERASATPSRRCASARSSSSSSSAS